MYQYEFHINLSDRVLILTYLFSSFFFLLLFFSPHAGSKIYTSSDNNLALKGFSILPNHLRKAHLRKYWWFCPISVSNAHTHDSIMFPLYQICRQEVSCVCVGTCGGWQPLLGSSEAPVSMTITTLPSFVYIKVRATSSEAHERRTGKKKDKTVFLPMPPLHIPVCFFSPLLCLFRSFYQLLKKNVAVPSQN